jgi:NAD(P)H-nitrite reductase large subunit
MLRRSGKCPPTGTRDRTTVCQMLENEIRLMSRKLDGTEKAKLQDELQALGVTVKGL